jgi:hypothetical protein
MSKCDLEIQLDKADRTYQAGESIRGRVTVRADAAVRCKGLTVALQWSTHGRGNRDSGPESKVQLFEGEWDAGAQHAYGFELIAPSGPVSYHGSLLNVDHYLTARVDLPWAIDPKAVIDVLIVPKPGAAQYDFGPSYKPPAAELQTEGKAMVLGSVLLAGCFGLPGLAIMAGGVAFGISWIRGTATQGAFPAIFMFLFGAVFALVGFGIAFILQKRRVAQRRLGNPLVNLSPQVARPGDRVSAQVTLQPRTNVKLTGAKAILRCKERAVSGSGTNRTTHNHQVHESEVGLNAPPQLEAGQPASFSVSLEIPRDAPATFAASDNDVKWVVALHVGIDGWPDWERDYPITVRP